MKVTSALNIEGRTLDFVFCVCCGYAPTRAATLSGWAIGSASRLLQQPEVLAALLSIEQNVGTTIARYRKRKAKIADAPAKLVRPEVSARPNVDPDA